MRGKKGLIGGKRVGREEEKSTGTGLIYQVKTRQNAEYVHLKVVWVHRFTYDSLLMEPPTQKNFCINVCCVQLFLQKLFFSLTFIAKLLAFSFFCHEIIFCRLSDHLYSGKLRSACVHLSRLALDRCRVGASLNFLRHSKAQAFSFRPAGGLNRA